MTDIVERLRIWPAADGKDGLSGTFVEALMVEAADEIERLTRERDALLVGLRISERYFLVEPEVHKWKLEQIQAALAGKQGT